MPHQTLPADGIVLGLWPIAGVTTMGVTPQDAQATLHTALEIGIRTFDTAMSYGYHGESDRCLGEAIRGRRDECFVIGKVGQRWVSDASSTSGFRRRCDGSAKQLTLDAELHLKRIGIEQFDLLMLHQIDPAVPLAESARAIESLQSRGLCRQIGVCNVTSDQFHEFRELVGCVAIQCPLNLVQPESLQSLIPACRTASCAVLAYWVLMKGLLAGKISREHAFAPGDSRGGYAIFQGEQRQRIHDLLDAMTPIAAELEMTIAQLSISWVLSQPGVTAALIGARRAAQVREIAGAKRLSTEVLAQISKLSGHQQ